MITTRPSVRHFLLGALLASAVGVLACSKGTTPPEKLGTPVAAASPAVTKDEPADRAGQPARFEFTLADMNGASVELAGYKGRPLVINFWATWCPPCKLEIPWFIELKKKYAAQGLEILGVSIDDHAPELKAFAAEYKMNYPVLVGLDHDKMLEAYDAVESVPVTWFIRKNGLVQSRNIGINSREYFETQIKALF